jgi:hypothetical protein
MYSLDETAVKLAGLFDRQRGPAVNALSGAINNRRPNTYAVP